MENSVDLSREALLAPDVAVRAAIDMPSDAITLVGYLGDGESEKYRHLYRDLSCKVFLRIPVDAILDRVPEAGGDLTQGRSVLVIDPEVTLLLCEVVRASPRAVPDRSYPWPYPYG